MSTTVTARKALHAYLSGDAHEQWHSFAALNGVSVSAVLEALAPELEEDAPNGSASMQDRLGAVVAEARRTDAARRRRRR